MDANFTHHILELSNSSFGDNYMTMPELKEIIQRHESTVIVENSGDQLMGFSILQVLTIAELKRVLFVDEKWIEEQFGNYAVVGYRKMTAVHPHYKGQGVAQRLFQKGQEWLKRKTTVTISANWVQKTAPSFDPILLKNGFKPLLEVPQYWKQDSLRRGFVCPSCGLPPCECNATIYANFES